MNHRKKMIGISAACLLAVPLTLSGCSLFGSENASAIDPPPAEVEAQMLQTAGGGEAGVFSSADGSAPDSTVAAAGTGESAAPTANETGALPASASVTEDGSGGPASPASKEEESRTAVYLQNDSGLLAPIALKLPGSGSADALKQSLEALVEGGAYAASLPQGFHGVLPAGTVIKNVSVDKGTAVVEFGGSFTDYRAADERKVLEAVAWTLTGEDGVSGVRLMLNGKNLTEMPLLKTPLDRPLTRSLGINLEKKGMTTNSSAVTVYFASVTPEGESYYVPVTRYVDPGHDLLQAAMQELIAGPDAGDGLESVLTSGTKLESVRKEQNGVVNVALTDDMFGDTDAVPAEFLESVVLTLSQNADDSLVQVRLNGKETVKGSDNVDYGQPVSAPQYINELAL
ncbi:hypothetical protein F4V43_14560 [Paenibacillus spiritus]|uniref:GerMN domain-containing protein n=1 Tax=Paenibacillus spiritus TaxID=2496557 RepID=A0A5J5G0X2_9BACL|nr:GerMN domain-containing protein [Paenibacillus spiritus]KAA9000354.1 hypothetical protein F4V43_14560 [Paenibacillus spiritus]